MSVRGGSGSPGPAGAPGTISQSGVAILDFGPNPVSQAEIAVTGQTGIVAGSRVRIWIGAVATADNGLINHIMAGTFLQMVVGERIPDVGFTIFVTSLVGLVSGTFRAEFIWSA